MTPDQPMTSDPAAPLSESLFQFWMMPMRVAQTMFETASGLIVTASEQARVAAETGVVRSQEATQHIAEEAEEQIARLDEVRGDTVINPAALVS